MAGNFSAIITPAVSQHHKEAPATLVAGRPVTHGYLHSTWVHASHLPLNHAGPKASLDPRVSSAKDFSPCYDDAGARFLLFEPRVETGFGTYVLMNVVLQPWAGGESTTLLRWHLVVEESWIEFPRGGRMMRNDVKRAKKFYCLGSGEAVKDNEVLEDGESAFAGLAVMNGSKFLLEIGWEEGMELVED